MRQVIHRPWSLVAAAVLLCAPCAMAETAALATPPAAVSPSSPAIPGITIAQTAFGVFADYDSAKAKLTPTSVVYRDGSQIGWVVNLASEKATVRWREEFVVPSPPKEWGVTANRDDIRPPQVSADKRMATTERRVPAAGGSISHWWKLDASDPAGPHTMRVYIDEVLVASFDFEVR